MLQLYVQEGTAASALAVTHPEPVAESFSHLAMKSCGVRTLPGKGVQMQKPFVGYLSMTQVFDSCDLLPVTL